MQCKVIVLGLLALFAAAGSHAAELTLAAEGRSDYQIVLPDTAPTPSISNSLAQVARLVQTAFTVNGSDVPVVAESQRDPVKPGIYLGNTAFARAHGVDVTTIKGWGYVHKAVGRDLIIAGHDHAPPATPEMNRRAPWDRIGTARGATDFLYRYAGVRFLYPDLGPGVAVGGIVNVDLLKSPAFEFLETSVIAVPDDLELRTTPQIDWNSGHPVRGSFYDIANNRFPLVDSVFGCHTYERAVPVDTYYETHPEYFALVGGKRLQAGQYCVSNPEFQELLYQDMVKWLELGFETVDLGQPDGFRACQCADCSALFDTGDDWSEKLWILHRQLCQRILKTYPDRYVTLMSYILTAKPPKTFKAFPRNVKMMLCGTNEDDIEPWLDYDVPGGFTAYIYNWCPNLVTRYTPMRTPRYVETQVKRLAKHNFRAIRRDGPGQLFGLEGPVYYVMGRMFDDAEHLQAKDLVHEFCGAAFGKAGGAMLRFYDRLYHGIEIYSEYLGTRNPAWSYKDIYGRGHKYLTDPFQMLGFLYTPDLIEALEKDLVQAEQSADTGRITARLMLVRREFDYLKHLSNVVNLYHAYQVSPDLDSRNRLLDAIDARNVFIDHLYDAEGSRELTTAGWAYSSFPFAGHSANHLRLAYNGYQEPMQDTCFNWDTTAMRTAPLPGAKRLTVPPIASAVTLDSSEWEKAVPDALRALPANAAMTQKTILRVLYDKSAILVRVDSGVAAATAAEIPPEEAVIVYLTPPAGTEISYRFTVGLDAESKSEAASGFVSDVMDPRYTQYDPDWSGDWSAETRLDPAKHRWLALLRIPYSTLGVEPPVAGTAWRANVGRCHAAGTNAIERSIWSATAMAKDMDDRSMFGEIVFE